MVDTAVGANEGSKAKTPDPHAKLKEAIKTVNVQASALKAMTTMMKAVHQHLQARHGSKPGKGGM